MTETGSKSSQWRIWAVAIPLVFQTWLIAALPLQAAIARVMGTTIILQTVPVDPYDPFLGYYVTLRYDISQRGILSTLEGWDTLKSDLATSQSTELLESGRSFFVILEAPLGNDVAASQPWQPVAVSRQRPRNLPANQFALRAMYRRDRVLYGLERYYLSETESLDLEERIRNAQTAEGSPRLRVEARIGPFGKAVPIALWLADQRIEL